jgi:hypothetical protein
MPPSLTSGGAVPLTGLQMPRIESSVGATAGDKLDDDEGSRCC